MKKPFIHRMYWVLAVAWLVMIFAKGYMGALMAELVVRAILIIAAGISLSVITLLFFGALPNDRVTLKHLSDGSTAVGKAIIGLAFMATGFTAIAWAFIALAVVRGGVAFWAEDQLAKAL